VRRRRAGQAWLLACIPTNSTRSSPLPLPPPPSPLGRGKLDFGTTVSAYRGFHLTAEFETPDLEYYFILGSDPCEVR